MIIRLLSFLGPPSVLDWLESFIGLSSEIPAREFYLGPPSARGVL